MNSDMNFDRFVRFVGLLLPIVALSSLTPAFAFENSATEPGHYVFLPDSSRSSYTATNTTQHLTFQFMSDEVRLTHRAGQGSLRLMGYGYGEHLHSPLKGEMAAKANRLEYHKGDLTEWYVNETAGLEQGFTLARRPDGGGRGEPLVISIAVMGDLRPVLSAGGADVLFESQGSEPLHYGALRSWDRRGRQLVSRLEVRERQIRLVIDDRNAEYPLVVDPVTSTTFTPAPSPGPTYTVGPNPTGVVAAEINSNFLSSNDGKLDLAVSSLNSTSVSILTGNGNGTFGEFTGLVGKGSRALAAADFNGDGFEDLVFVNPYRGITVFYNLGNSSFFAQTAYAAGTTPESVAVGDFNGDNCPDIAVTNNGDSTVSIFLNSCDSSKFRTFTLASTIPVGIGPTGIAAGNFFNGDPHLDLAVVNSGDGTVSILQGDGTGNFSLFGVPIILGQFGRTLDIGQWIAVGNLTKSGHQDIAIAGDSGVVVLLGNGDGTFQGPSVYSAHSNPDGIAIADLNLDGIADLAVTNAFSNDLSVLIGVGDGTFNPAVNFPVGSFPTAVATGDFNNDGRPDVAVTNFIDNTVTILLGTQWNISTCAANSCTLPAPPQTALFNTQFPLQLIARVTDASNRPVKGVLVTFSAPSSGPSAKFSPSPSSLTDANGEARVIATANATSGPAYSVTATAGFAATATFTLTNNPGTPSIAAVGGTPQSAKIGTTFATPLQARITDSNGNGIPGQAIVFAVPAGAALPGGTFPGGVTTIVVSPTDANGVAQTTFTANGTTGSYLVTATATAAGAQNTAVFALTNTGPPASVTAAAGTPQSAGVGSPFPGKLVARVTDGLSGSGNPIPGIVVTFAVNAVNGAGGLFAGFASATAVTDSTGSATSPILTANNTGGTYTVTASVAGVAQSAVFNLDNILPSVFLLPANPTMRQHDSLQYTINLGMPAPDGGVIVSLSSSNTSVVTVSPANVLIPGGSTTSRALITFNAIGVGSAQVSATAYGFVPDATTTVTVIPPLAQ